MAANIGVGHATSAIGRCTAVGRLVRDAEGEILLPRGPTIGDRAAFEWYMGHESTIEERIEYEQAYRHLVTDVIDRDTAGYPDSQKV